MRGGVGGGALLVVAADLAHEHDGLGLRVGLEELEALPESEPVDGVAAHADAGRLPEARAGEAHGDLVGQGPAARDDADAAGREQRGRHDAGVAAARGDDAGAVGADEDERPPGDRAVVEPELRDGLAHVADGDALGDEDGDADAALGGLDARPPWRSAPARR